MLTFRVERKKEKPKIVLNRSDICEVENSESQGVGMAPEIFRREISKKELFRKKKPEAVL